MTKTRNAEIGQQKLERERKRMKINSTLVLLKKSLTIPLIHILETEPQT